MKSLQLMITNTNLCLIFCLYVKFLNLYNVRKFRNCFLRLNCLILSIEEFLTFCHWLCVLGNFSTYFCWRYWLFRVIACLLYTLVYYQLEYFFLFSNWYWCLGNFPTYLCGEILTLFSVSKFSTYLCEKFLKLNLWGFS